MSDHSEPTAIDDRFDRGLAILRVVGDQDEPAVMTALADLAPDLALDTPSSSPMATSTLDQA